MPSPWNNAALNPTTAQKLGFKKFDVVKVEGPAGSFEASIYPLPGLHPDAVVVPRGNGHGKTAGTIERDNGVNPLVALAKGMDAATGAVVTAVTLGLPSVNVPVLSTTSVSTRSIRSRASAFLMSTPINAPRPTPTMIDMGVAKPRAHGQATINTATAATKAKENRGSGPKVIQPAKAIAATPITSGTNQAETSSAMR